jgi:hypothetical protein
MTHLVFSIILSPQISALLVLCLYCNYKYWTFHTEICMICKYPWTWDMIIEEQWKVYWQLTKSVWIAQHWTETDPTISRPQLTLGDKFWKKQHSLQLLFLSCIALSPGLCLPSHHKWAAVTVLFCLWLQKYVTVPYCSSQFYLCHCITQLSECHLTTMIWRTY